MVKSTISMANFNSKLLVITNNYGKLPCFMVKSTISMANFNSKLLVITNNYGKSPCFMVKSTISMANFNSKLLVIARGYLKRRFAKLLVTKRWWILGLATNCKNRFPNKNAQTHGRHVSKNILVLWFVLHQKIGNRVFAWFILIMGPFIATPSYPVI